MKQNLLERLLARQRKLMGELDAPPTPIVERSALAPAQRPPLATESQDLAQAERVLAEGQHAVASSLLKAHADRAGLPRTYLILAQLSTLEGHFDEAEAFLKRAERLDPNDQTVWAACADLYRHTRRFDQEFPYRRRLAYTTQDVPVGRYSALMQALIAAAPKFKGPAASEIELLAQRIMGSPEATPQAKVEAAEAIFNTRAPVDAAISLLVKSDPPGVEEQDVLAQWSYLSPWCTAHHVEMRRLNDEGVSGRRPTLVTLNNVCIHPKLQWTPILDSGRTIINGMASTPWPKRRDDPSSPLMMSGLAGVLLRLPKHPEQVNREALLIGSSGDFYRDAVEHLGALAIAEALNVSPGLPLVLARNAPAHLQEMLSLLGYGDVDRIEVDPSRLTRFDSLLVTTRLSAGIQSVDPLLPRWYRRKLAACTGVGGTRRRLFLAPSRSLQLDGQVAQWLEAHGFAILDPDGWTTQETITQFSSAAVVISPMHASLTLTMLMPEGSSVLALVHPQHLQSTPVLPFQALCGAAKLRFSALACVPSADVAGADGPLQISSEALAKALEQVFDHGEPA